MARWTDLPSLRRRGRTLPGELEEGIEKASEAGGVKCRDCRKQFTVTVGTVFQGSKIPLRQWVTVIHLMNDSANLLNARQLHTRLGLTYKSASFLVKRLGEGTRKGLWGRDSIACWRQKELMLSEKNRAKDASVPKKEQGYRVLAKVKGVVGQAFWID
ncbi:MAG: hypothetical protein V3T23_07660 [Nitrososphaerales archaeon]